MRIKISGASDDLIEIHGDIREELVANYDDPTVIALSNGAVVRIEYDGDWRIQKLAQPSGIDMEILPAGNHDDEMVRDYSDVAIIGCDEIDWIVKADDFIRQQDGND